VEQVGQTEGVRLNCSEPCWSQNTWEQAVTHANPLSFTRHWGELHCKVYLDADMAALMEENRQKRLNVA